MDNIITRDPVEINLGDMEVIQAFQALEDPNVNWNQRSSVGMEDNTFNTFNTFNMLPPDTFDILPVDNTSDLSSLGNMSDILNNTATYAPLKYDEEALLDLFRKLTCKQLKQICRAHDITLERQRYKKGIILQRIIESLL